MSVDTLSATAAAGVDSLRSKIAGAIKQASNTTGASFQYLLATAKMESDFNPSASASTSSAGGLYQFIDQTWLGTVKEAGAQLGYSQYADAITKSSSGTYSVSDPDARSAIMKLRNDPVASSAMAAVLTQSNSFKLTGAIGRRPTDAELYMAHFMGSSGAAKLITSAEDNPQASGAALFPNAAAANRSIFYDRSGNARSVSDVYSVLTSRYASAANSSTTQNALATFGVTPAGGTTTTVASAASVVTPVASSTYLQGFPDARFSSQTIAASASASATTSTQAANTQASTTQAANTQASPSNVFRSLFQVGDRPQPVSPAVQELWGNSSSLTADASASSSTSPAATAAPAQNFSVPQALDLFSDRNGTFSG